MDVRALLLLLAEGIRVFLDDLEFPICTGVCSSSLLSSSSSSAALVLVVDEARGATFLAETGDLALVLLRELGVFGQDLILGLPLSLGRLVLLQVNVDFLLAAHHHGRVDAVRAKSLLEQEGLARNVD
ncbi:hypothetical protein EV127DRAFT_94047 [Xylaria flabelliformis]|nr:hypothetical protein EV127DRAFT_94047 [Xylaria flabelliformis]